MAGPSVAVKVLGDVTGLGKSFDDAGSKGTSAASKMHSAFRGVLDSLNQSGVLGPFGAALGTADAALSSIMGHAKEIGPVMMGVGGAVAGVGMALQAAGSKDQAAHQQLQAAVEATGHSYDQYADRVESAIKTQEKYGTTADVTQDALRKLTQATDDPAKALDMLGTAADLARAKHEDLSTASGQLAKAVNGSGRILKEFGITTKDAAGQTKSQSEILSELSGKLSGQASAGAATFTGHLAAIKASAEDHIALFGQQYGPALTTAGAAMTGLGAAIQVTGAATQFFKEQTILSTAAQKIATAAQWAWNAAMDANPIMLIVLALAALVAAIILAYQHVSWFRDGVDAMGRFVVATFHAIVDVASSVFSWIAGHWPLLLAILTGPFGLAVYEIVSHWQQLIGWFAGLPGQIASIASHMWDGILNAFRAVLNGVIDLWNRMHFTLPKIDVGPIHAGGETIGVPQIPHLAEGGLMTGSGLVYAHAGEVISPAPDGGRNAPAVNVEHAHFSEGLDIDAFMRRAAWVVTTQKV
jgi:Arc/MetJ-type ribon-helix-helix transcriptional regulator